MPRQARIDAPGALHHIICRGLERKPIFIDDHDRNRFLDRLGTLLIKTRTKCFAWALIPNHFHLLLMTGVTPIASIMERLLTGYAVSFNHRYQRHGHLFQNRYKSILCQTEPYLLELVRYIHLNPVRAGIVKTLDQLNAFAYTGHAGLVSGAMPKWQTGDEVLCRFGQEPETARRGYAAFIADGFAMGQRPDLIGGGLVRSSGGWELVSIARHFGEHLKSDERILGDSDFVDEVLSAASETIDDRSLCYEKGQDLLWVAQRVCEVLQIDSSEVWKPGKRATTVKARSLLCYWATRELRMTAEAVSKILKLSESGVIRAAQRGEQLAQTSGWRLI